MEKEQIRQKIEQFITQQFIFDQKQKLGKDDSLMSTGTIDSTGILEVVTFLEEHFAITVEDEEMVPGNLDSINKISDFVARKLA